MKHIILLLSSLLLAWMGCVCGHEVNNIGVVEFSLRIVKRNINFLIVNLVYTGFNNYVAINVIFRLVFIVYLNHLNLIENA